MRNISVGLYKLWKWKKGASVHFAYFELHNRRKVEHKWHNLCWGMHGRAKFLHICLHIWLHTCILHKYLVQKYAFCRCACTTWEQMAEMVLRNARWPTGLCATARVRYDKTTDAISDRSPHKYAGYLTPLLPIAAASPDCQPRPSPPPKPPLLFPATELPFKIQLKMLQIKTRPSKMGI